MSRADVDIALVNNVPCGIVTAGEDGMIGFVNEYMCQLLGYSRAELEGSSVECIFTISAKIFYQTHFAPMIRMHKSADEIFLSLKAKAGTSIPVIVTARKTGDTLYFVFVTVWRRKEYEEEILNAKRAAEEAVEKNEVLIKFRNELELRLAETDRQVTQLNQFNADYIDLSRIISHDLHEPIRKLLIHTDLLMNEITPGDVRINEQVIKMIGFINRLRMLTFALQEYVAIDLSREGMEQVNLNDLVQNSFLHVKEEEATEASLATEDLPVVEGIPSQLSRLFLEIFRNNFGFRKDEEPLKISVRSTEFRNNLFKEVKHKYRYVPFVRIEIGDNGMGIPDEYSDYIFELFKKAHPEKPGAGFGLSLCRKIVHKHNGTILAKPTSNGLIIQIQLPLSQKDFK